LRPQVLLIGASGGVGSACVNLLRANDYDVTEWTSKNLDLNFAENVFACDFTPYDILINCAGHSHGTYRGFLQNSWSNQVSQIMVNYVSALAVLKHYALSRNHGKYVWCSSDRIDTPTVYQSVYASTKAGTKFAIDLIRREVTHISILEVKFGLTKTNFRSRNFEGTKTAEEVEQSYGNDDILYPEQIAKNILYGIENNLHEVKIKYE
jgi:short-subunit dehydrogenase